MSMQIFPIQSAPHSSLKINTEESNTKDDNEWRDVKDADLVDI